MSNIELREYQKSSIESLRSGLSDGHIRQILAASTGAGKSIMAMSMLASAKQKNKKILFICDRRILVEQFSLHLSRSHIDHGCIMAGHWRSRPDENIQIASIQTLERMRDWPQVDLVVVDEIHAVMRRSLKVYMDNNPKVKVIGLTATPFHADLAKYFTSVTNVITMEELVESGFLVPFKIFIAKEIDTSGVKITAGEWQKDALEERGLRLVGDVVSEYAKLSHAIFGGYKKTICFSSGVEHSIALSKQFANIGLNFIPISYKDADDVKRELLESFAQPDTNIHGIISSDILVRGFDQTDIQHVILARPLRKSFSMHVQMLGRGARPHSGKDFCVIQDHAGNFLRFRDDWDKLYTNGVERLEEGGSEKPKKEPTEHEKKQSKCPSCGALWVSTTNVCNSCGHVRQKLNMVMEVPGELLELTASNKQQMQVNKQFYGELLYYCKEKNYNDGWAKHKYREKFGVDPVALPKEIYPTSIKTKKWIQSRNIRYAKSKERMAA